MRAIAGFTLVELLVVIGIIAVLVGILLPSLQSAKKAANTVKCAASLREIGNACAMYANDNHGWAPPAKVSSYYRISYTGWAKTSAVGADDFGPQFWYQFLAKYVTRARMGSSAYDANSTVAGQMQSDARKSVFWGCPEFQGYINNTFGGSYGAGTNFTQTGYGFNSCPEYTGSYPPVGGTYNTLGDQGYEPSPPVNGTAEKNHYWNATSAGLTCKNGTSLSYQQDWNSLTFGTWYKMSQYTHASDRALVADAQYWLVESSAVPLSGAIPGQKFYTDLGGIFSKQGQTTLDFYRHGRFPSPANATAGTAGIYQSAGGKVEYNVLFCDGHVTTMTDRESGYRATRMRFPG